MEWRDLPVEGGFTVQRGGALGKHGYAGDADKLEQSRVYGKYMRWAEEVCGVTEAELRQHLEAAAAIPRNRRGANGLPVLLGCGKLRPQARWERLEARPSPPAPRRRWSASWR